MTEPELCVNHQRPVPCALCYEEMYEEERADNEALVRAIQVVLPDLAGGPTLGAFGIAREDCALAHIDYFGGVDSARAHLINVLAETGNLPLPEHIAKMLSDQDTDCDCKSCIGEEEAAKAREKHKAAYTNVKEWKR